MLQGYSLKWLFVAVAVVGASCWALRNASYKTNGYLLLGVFAVLSASLVGALVRAGAARAFWIGAAVIGWLSFLVNGGPALSLASRVALPTDEAIHFLHAHASRTLSPEEAVNQGWFPADAFSAPMPSPRAIQLPMFEYFRDAAHHLTTLVAAGLGGLLGRYFYRLNRIAAESPRATT
ncbi:MAG: hypothetical protein U0836_01520 [Pirellulales bacterium]